MSTTLRPPARLVRDAVNFGAVGVVSYLVDIAAFNGLRVAALDFFSDPLPAKTIGVICATVVAWLGSRYWTFRHHLRPDVGQEFVEYVLVAAGGYALNILVLYVSHYVLGFRSLLADNISGNLVGAALGTVFRFVAYRSWVYRAGRAQAPPRNQSRNQSPK